MKLPVPGLASEILDGLAPGLKGGEGVQLVFSQLNCGEAVAGRCLLGLAPFGFGGGGGFQGHSLLLAGAMPRWETRTVRWLSS